MDVGEREKGIISSVHLKLEVPVCYLRNREKEGKRGLRETDKQIDGYINRQIDRLRGHVLSQKQMVGALL